MNAFSCRTTAPPYIYELSKSLFRKNLRKSVSAVRRTRNLSYRKDNAALEDDSGTVAVRVEREEMHSVLGSMRRNLVCGPANTFLE